jgi:NAD(P)H-flavin reductase
VTGPVLADLQQDAWLPRRHVVKRVRRESADTVTLFLDPCDADDSRAARYLPGQFNMLYLFGHGEAPVSVSGVSRRTGYVRHTIKGVGPLSRALTRLNIGDLVGLRGPFGNGWPMAALGRRNLLLVAGGIGVAPIMSVLRAVTRHPERYGRIDLIYGSRTPADILFERQLLRWAERGRIHLHLTVDQADEQWDGPVGFVTTPLLRLPLEPDNSAALLCGPEVMMRHCLSQLVSAGMAPGDIYLSMERSMRCAFGVCGHCQWGPAFICKNGPVFNAGDIGRRLHVREL